MLLEAAGNPTMSQTLEQLGIENLTTSERLDLIGLLWDSISDADSNPPIPEWHLREVSRRRALADANPDASLSWEEVKARLMGAQ